MIKSRKQKIKLDKENKKDISLFSKIMKYNCRELKISSKEKWKCFYLNGMTEFNVALHCSDNKIEYFLPLLLDKNQKVRTLWPNYIFCKLNKDKQYILETHKDVRGSLGPESNLVESNLIQYLNDFSTVNEIVPHFSCGENIIVKKGLLEGSKAKIEEVIENEQSLRITIEFFKRPFKQNVNIFEVLPADNKIPTFDIIPAENISEFLDESSIKENINVEIDVINDQLVKYLSNHPKALYEISPYKFEELIAHIFEDMGYEVKLTPKAGDYGRDIFAVIKIPPNQELLTIIECKRYNPNRKIGLSVVERFLTTIRERDKANIGLIATTSHFSSVAENFVKDYSYLMKLHDYEDVCSWLSSYGSWSESKDVNLWLPNISLHSNIHLYQEEITFPKNLLVSG